MHNDPHIIEEVETKPPLEEEEDLMVEEEVDVQDVPTKVSLIIFMLMKIIKEIEKLMI
jgi:hypothetical protein